MCVCVQRRFFHRVSANTFHSLMSRRPLWNTQRIHKVLMLGKGVAGLVGGTPGIVKKAVPILPISFRQH